MSTTVQKRKTAIDELEEGIAQLSKVLSWMKQTEKDVTALVVPIERRIHTKRGAGKKLLIEALQDGSALTTTDLTNRTGLEGSTVSYLLHRHPKSFIKESNYHGKWRLIKEGTCNWE